MREVNNSNKPLHRRSPGQWLFNPFRFVAGYKAMLLGLGIILISAFLGYLSDTHFDGVLDVHTGMDAPLWFFVAEVIIDWLAIATPLFFFALIVSGSSLRMVDVFGTQALARWPHLITSIVMFPEANRRFGIYLMSRFTATGGSATLDYADMCVFILAAMVAVLMTVWMVALMYRAYALSCNIKGAKAIITFIVSIIGAEVLSKFLILLILQYKPYNC